MQLRIGSRGAWIKAEKRTGLQPLLTAHAGAGEQILRARQEIVWKLHMAPKRQWFGHPKFDLNLQMVMQVLPDTGQICRHIDIVLSQGIGWTNPTEHHQMWRADGTG